MPIIIFIEGQHRENEPILLAHPIWLEISSHRYSLDEGGRWLQIFTMGPDPNSLSKGSHLGQTLLISFLKWNLCHARAADMVTLRENRLALSRLRLRPRVLTGVDTVDLRTTVLGSPVAMPVRRSAMPLQNHYESRYESRYTSRSNGSRCISSCVRLRPLGVLTGVDPVDLKTTILGSPVSRHAGAEISNAVTKAVTIAVTLAVPMGHWISSSAADGGGYRRSAHHPAGLAH
jgi:hypothetical protein